ncbi:MAG TPA: nickel-dependent lactate racemase [Anaerolineaceae bacterium]
MQVKLAYGHKGLWVDIPDSVHPTIIEPLFTPGLADERAAIRSALAAPTGSAPLADLVTKEDTVAVVFSDITRPMPNDRVLPVLLQALAEAGVRDEAVTLINGLASHRQQTGEELARMLGEDVARRYRILQHDAWDDASLAPVALNHAGRMVRINRAYLEASVRILTGFIEPHFFAGFSGGPKAVLPGIADIEAIMDNHNATMIGSPQSTWAVTHGNPIWEEMHAIAAATRPTFLLNVTLNKHKQITGVFAGDLDAAHAAGTEFLRQKAMQAVAEPFDVVITSNSGYPLDLNLYQSVKGMSAAAQIVCPGGDIIIAAECWDGIPAHGQYARLLRQAESLEAVHQAILAPGFRSADQWQVQIQAQIQKKARVHVYAGGLSDEELTAAKVLPCRSIERTLAGILERNPQASVAILPEGPQTVPYLEKI